MSEVLYCTCNPENVKHHFQKELIYHSSHCLFCSRPFQPKKEKEMITDGTKVTNEQGGSQSFLLANFASIPPEVLKLLAQCLGFGAMKYGDRNWEKISIEDNLSHAMNHINEWNLGDRSEPHLVNAMARLTFALSIAVNSNYQPRNYTHPDMEKVLAEKFGARTPKA